MPLSAIPRPAHHRGLPTGNAGVRAGHRRGRARPRGPPVTAQIAIKIFGDDLNVLRQKAEEVREAIAGVPGTADLAVEQVAGIKYLQIRIDRDRIARYGINVTDVQDVIAPW